MGADVWDGGRGRRWWPVMGPVVAAGGEGWRLGAVIGGGDGGRRRWMVKFLTPILLLLLLNFLLRCWIMEVTFIYKNIVKYTHINRSINQLIHLLLLCLRRKHRPD